MVEFILYVADQQKSCDFYAEVLGIKPVLHVPGMTEFALAEQVKLGLMPEAGIAKILGDKTTHPATGNGIPRCELYLLREDAKELWERAMAAGGKEISPMMDRDWGNCVGYFADADGHIIALATRLK